MQMKDRKKTRQGLVFGRIKDPVLIVQIHALYACKVQKLGDAARLLLVGHVSSP
jgi:hypothetical protein